MRAVWSGAIAFGLVNIPIKLYAAIGESRLDFDMLDKKDLAPIKYKRVNDHTGKEVPWSNIVKGYKIDDKYIVMEEADFENASPEKTKLIQMEAFVNPAEIDVILYDNAYYIGPTKGGERVFALFEEALNKSGKSGIGTFVLRNKERPVSIRSASGVMLLHTLRFFQEIRNPAEFEAKKGGGSVNKKEVGMAVDLIKQLGGKFDIKAYKDEYTLKLMKFIKAKASGKKLAPPKKEISSGQGDLLEQLQKSLASNVKKPAAKKATAKKLPAKKLSAKKLPAKAKSKK